jgi:Tfp pilus assembly protein PilX
MLRLHRDERGQSLVIVLSLITIMFLLGSSLAVHASVALRSTRASEGQADDFYAADAATELGIWWQRNGKAGNPPAQTINGVTTSTTISTAGGGGGSCPAAPSIRWMNGFESGVIYRTNGSWSTNLAGGFTFVQSGSSGVVDAVATPARSGGFSMRIAPTSAGGNYAFLEAPYGVTLGNWQVVHVAVRFGALPTRDTNLVSLTPGSSTGWAHPSGYLYYKQSTGKWAVGLGSTSITVSQESSGSVALDTWYTFDLRMQVLGTNTRTIEWYIDGVAQPTASVVDGAGSGAGPRVAFGQYALSTGSYGSAYTAYFDDAVISLTSSDFPIGDINISPLRPDGFGTHVNPTYFQTRQGYPPDANSWQLLDDSPMNNNVDLLRMVTASATSYLEVTFQDTTQTCIRGAAAEMDAHPEGTSANNTKTSTFDGATESVLYQGDISFATTGLAFAIRPITPGGAWTQARVNGLKMRFGYGVDINPVVAWDDLMVQLAWTTVNASPATVTIVGTGGGSTITTDYLDAGAGVPTLDTWTVTK